MTASSESRSKRQAKIENNPFRVGGKAASLLPVHIRCICRCDICGDDVSVNVAWHNKNKLWLAKMIKDGKIKADSMKRVLQLFKDYSVDDLRDIITQHRTTLLKEGVCSFRMRPVNGSCKACSLPREVILSITAPKEMTDEEKRAGARKRLGFKD